MRVALLALALLIPSALPAPINPSKVDSEAIAAVEDAYPGEGAIVTAIRIHESGCKFYECGHAAGFYKGYRQSDIAKFYPKKQRNYIECARSVARFTLEYSMITGKKPDYFGYLALRYHAGTPESNRTWFKSVKTIYLSLTAKKGKRGQGMAARRRKNDSSGSI